MSGERERARCYLAGPMRGLPEFNFPAFITVASYLRTAGWDVASPAEMDLARMEAWLYEKDPDNYHHPDEVWRLATDTEDAHFTFAECMAEDLPAVCNADAVVVMPGWEESTGTALEMHVAHAVEVPVYTWPGMRRIFSREKQNDMILAALDTPEGGALVEEMVEKGFFRPLWTPETHPADLQRIVPMEVPEDEEIQGGTDAVYHPEAMKVLTDEARIEAGEVTLTETAKAARWYHEQDITLPRYEPKPKQTLPVESADRKATPITSGVIDYFPAALAEVARVSKAGNDKHNPGQPMHHARGKSSDHADSIARHLIDRGGIDPDTGLRHSGELAWRALALLQQELEDEGLAPMPRGAK